MFVVGSCEGGLSSISAEYFASHRSGFDLEKSPASLPASVDWGLAGVLTDVKDQGLCGSCWAFVTTGIVEALVAIQTGFLISLSEQHLIDCNEIGNNFGCDGGNYFYGLQQISPFYSAKSYPFVDDQAERYVSESICSSPGAEEASLVTSNVTLLQHPSFTISDLMALVAKHPVGVGASGYQDVFRTYKGGILDSDLCGNDIDHALLLVGYGTSDNGTPYWLLKNSWGTEWGEEGYVRLKRSEPSETQPFGQCAILKQVSYISSATCVGTDSYCENLESSLFCTENQGCQTSSFFKDLAAASDPIPGYLIAIIVIASIVAVGGFSYVLFTKYHKPYLNRSLTTLANRSPGKPAPRVVDPQEYEDDIIEFRRRILHVEFLKRKADDERDVVIARYIDRNERNIDLALEEYIEDHQR